MMERMFGQPLDQMKDMHLAAAPEKEGRRGEDEEENTEERPKDGVIC